MTGNLPRPAAGTKHFVKTGNMVYNSEEETDLKHLHHIRESNLTGTGYVSVLFR